MTTLKCDAACSGVGLALCLMACPHSDRLNPISHGACDPRADQPGGDDDALMIVFDARDSVRSDQKK